jgi:CBS domain-containing protein
VGVITDRDVVIEVIAMDLDATVITAGDIMSRELVTAHESLPLTEAIALMHTRRIRRLPIVNEENRLTGLVSIDDLLPFLADALSGVAGAVVQELQHESRTRR